MQAQPGRCQGQGWMKEKVKIRLIRKIVAGGHGGLGAKFPAAGQFL